VSQQINLFNPIFLKQKKHFSAITMVQALGLILLGCVILSAYASFRVSRRAVEARDAAAQLTIAQAQLAKMEGAYTPRTKSQSLQDEIRKADDEVRGLQQVFGTLQRGDLGNTKGYAEYMRAFARQITDGVWLTGFGIGGAGSEISLEGKALQPELVPAYLMRLKREPVLQGKSFATLVMQVPRDGKNNNANPPVDKSKAVPAYIEFNLRSSSAPTDEVTSTGEETR
jgi:hypothetical protein